jgi:hypothetical protein
VKQRLASLVMAILIAGCGEQRITGVSSHIDADILAALAARGIDTVNVYDDGEYVIAENDMVFRKSDLRRSIKSKRDIRRPASLPGPDYHWATDAYVYEQNRLSITVDISQISDVPSWQDAARRAIVNWSNIPGVDLVITESGSADIQVVFGDCGNPNAIACAELPQGDGNTGTFLRIVRSTTFDNFSVGQKEWVLTHEFGHNVGLHHTDLGSGFPGVHFIPGTPTSEANSVMVSVFPGSAFEDFSAGDIKAARILFPYRPRNLRMTSSPVMGENVTLAWDAVAGASYYEVWYTYHYWVLTADGWWAWEAYNASYTTTATTFNSDAWYTGDGSCNNTFRVRALFPDGAGSHYAALPVETCYY